jgi:2-oxoisovalerate dehydrogenase E1 component
MGEDLHDPYGGAFKVTAGLSSDFPDRVISTPISEAGITGAGIGLALAGFRPIVEIMFADFLTLCIDQLYNHAVKFPGLFPACSVPLVIRAPSGGRRGYGPTHSQSPENILVSIPGLTVVCPSQRHAVDQLLVNAVTAWPNPTVFLEHKLLYGEVMDPGPFTPLVPGPGDLGADLFPTLSAGEDDPDVTLVAFGGMVPVVERAAALLRNQAGLRVRIVVPALLSPMPRESLIDRLLDDPCIFIAEESHHEFGVAAELLASLAEVGYAGIAARAGTAPVPIASARSLERSQILDEHGIVAHVMALLNELDPGHGLS